jgi:chaperonin GroEL
MAVKAPGLRADEQAAALEDLAVLTGGRRLLRAAGDQLGRVGIADLGRARRAWANKDHFGIVGGKGDPRGLRRQIASLRAAHAATQEPQARKLLRQRLGRLCGGAATLWVGGATESDITIRKDVAERAAAALRGAIAGGVLPGAGVALLACQPALRRAFERSSEPDERAAYRVLLDGISAPIRAIASNAGYDAGTVIADLAQASSGYGLDARSGQVVDVACAGILDVATTQQTAIYSAISAAALALTIDVLVYRTQPEVRAANP